MWRFLGPRGRGVGCPFAGSPSTHRTDLEIEDMAIALYNTLTRRVEPLDPITPGVVRMFVCGPSRWGCYHAPPLTDPYVPISSIRFFT